ncbi:MAG: SSU ribosomal protein S9p (S16e), partial [uncultured Craurococcus sp.]
ERADDRHARRSEDPGAVRCHHRRGPRPARAEARRLRPRLCHRPPQGRRGPRLGEARQGRDDRQRQARGDLFRPAGAADAALAALPGRRPLPAVRRDRDRGRRRPLRPGRRGAPRHQPRADQLRAGVAADPEEGRLPDPRPARRRAEEVRQGEGTTFVPVQQAL